MWQAEADTELTLFATPATAVGQILLNNAKVSWYHLTTNGIALIFKLC